MHETECNAHEDQRKSNVRTVRKILKCLIQNSVVWVVLQITIQSHNVNKRWKTNVVLQK